MLTSGFIVYESPETVAIEDKKRHHTSQVGVPSQRQPAIVEHNPILPEARSDYSVILIAWELAYNDKPQILLCDSRLR
jgi:hypothetical protein